MYPHLAPPFQNDLVFKVTGTLGAYSHSFRMAVKEGPRKVQATCVEVKRLPDTLLPALPSAVPKGHIKCEPSQEGHPAPGPMLQVGFRGGSMQVTGGVSASRVNPPRRGAQPRVLCWWWDLCNKLGWSAPGWSFSMCHIL